MLKQSIILFLCLSLLSIGASSQNVYYQKITSVSQLIEGAEYIIVCEANNMAMGSIGENGKGTATPVVIDNGLINNSEASIDAIELRLAINKSEYKLHNSELSNYLCAGDDKTNLAIDVNGTSACWQILFDDEGNVLMYTDKDTSRYLMYNSGNKYFGYYSQSYYGTTAGNIKYNKIQLYCKVDKVTLSEKVNGYGTYYTTYKYKLPSGLNAYAICETDINNGTLTPTLAYSAGNNVPANSALLFKGDAAGDYYLVRLDNYTSQIAAAECMENNYLEGNRDTDGKTLSQREGVYYYKLTTKDSTNPGFYWGADDGEPFILSKSTTAYLALPASNASTQGLRLNFTTSINETLAHPNLNKNHIYSLAGRKVINPAQSLSKGIYIINGKKTYIK